MVTLMKEGDLTFLGPRYEPLLMGRQAADICCCVCVICCAQSLNIYLGTDHSIPSIQGVEGLQPLVVCVTINICCDFPVPEPHPTPPVATHTIVP